jgi:hypothetical protein
LSERINLVSVNPAGQSYYHEPLSLKLSVDFRGHRVRIGCNHGNHLDLQEVHVMSQSQLIESTTQT